MRLKLKREFLPKSENITREIQNGISCNDHREIQQNHETLPELLNVIIRKQYTCGDIMNCIKTQFHIYWMKLMSLTGFLCFYNI